MATVYNPNPQARRAFRARSIAKRAARFASVVAVPLSLYLALMTTVAGSAAADARLRLDTTYETWGWDRADDEAVRASEWTTRLGCDYELKPGLTLQLRTGWVSAGMEPDCSGGKTAVSCPLALGARVAYRVGDRWLIRLGMNAPTGTTGLSPEESQLAQVLGSRIMTFAGGRLGEGSGVDFGLSHAFRAGRLTIGSGIGYAFRGSYDAVGGGPAYDPGNRLSLAGGFDLGGTRYARWLLRTNVRTVFYTVDRHDGSDVYQTGDRYELQTLLRRRWAMTSGWVSASWITYGQAHVLGTGVLPDRNLRMQGDEFYFDAGMWRTITPRFSARVGSGMRFIEANEDGMRKARRHDIIAGCRWIAAPRLGVELQARYSAGSLTRQTWELNNRPGSDLTGVGMTAAMTLDL